MWWFSVTLDPGLFFSARAPFLQNDITIDHNMKYMYVTNLTTRRVHRVCRDEIFLALSTYHEQVFIIISFIRRNTNLVWTHLHYPGKEDFLGNPPLATLFEFRQDCHQCDGNLPKVWGMVLIWMILHFTCIQTLSMPLVFMKRRRPAAAGGILRAVGEVVDVEQSRDTSFCLGSWVWNEEKGS